MSTTSSTGQAWRFIILLGCVSLLADVTYEGARSIVGPYLATLGASATIVGTVAGLGELIGYGLRIVSGYVSDKTGKYWTTAIVGYIINLFSVPLLALTHTWPFAAILVATERLGKAIRNPARDAMLSYAVRQVGSGRGFGVHQAMDQIGAVTGPILVSAMLLWQGSYRISFAVLLIPALMAMSVLFFARYQYPQPQHLESVGSTTPIDGKIPPIFWLFLAGAALVGFGFVDFALVAFHFHQAQVVSTAWIPLFYSLAMATSALSSIVIGHLYDAKGISALVYVTVASALCTPLLFLGGFYESMLGMMLWGIGMGCQTTIMSAIVAEVIAGNKRGLAYGILNVAFGLSWFIGSALMGYLYDTSLSSLILVSVGVQLAGAPLYALAGRLLRP